MSEQKMEIVKKNSEVKATKDELVYLSYNHEMLLPCSIVSSDESITFKFETQNIFPFSTILNYDEDKYRLLANCADLYILNNELEFSMNPENLMYDINMRPKVLIRDKKDEYSADGDFIKKYKALSAAVLNPKYKYEDYYNGGADLFKKNHDTYKIYECDDVNRIKDYLIEKYKTLCSDKKEKKVLIEKKNLKFMKFAFPILILIILITSSFTALAYIKTIPMKETLLSADDNYLDGNYIEVQEVLSDIAVDDMPESQKYVLARSYIASEGITQEQKTNILNGITTNTDISVLDYWIYIGRLDFDSAIDNAQKIGDDELLLYAYIKQLSGVKEDNTITGEEKASKINELEEKINSISDSLTQTGTEPATSAQ